MFAKPKASHGEKRKFPGSVLLLLLSTLVILLLTRVVVVQGSGSTAKDPGPRTDNADAGAMISGLTAHQQAFFTAGQADFVQVESITGAVANTGAGLGPRFNAESCGACHAQPATGGTSPSPTSPTPGAAAPNPEVAAATDQGASNTVPDFITSTGPVREARFILNSTFTALDGGVHDLYTITGRKDVSSNTCSIAQPNFTQAEQQGNVIFRIPTPVFGAGLIEAIEDSTITANMNANTSQKQSLGIGGAPNTSGNDGTITRFGWKAQNKSLLMFAGEAYNVEMGVTNNLFTQERDETPGCVFNPTPEDQINFDSGQAAPDTLVITDIQRFEAFMTFLAPPAQSSSGITNCGSPPGTSPCSASIANGSTQFTSIGCVLCHTTSLQTSPSSVTALSNQTASLFSDLLLHHMGPGLADNIFQGMAQGDQFRTALLWGLGQRLFFLHDGRATDLVTAIQDHSSKKNSLYPASEANAVVNNFNALSSANQQDLLNFLRSL